MHQSSGQIFSPGQEDLRAVHFPPALIPSPAMNRQLLSQHRPHRNRSLVYFIPKPCLSNFTHSITPVIRPLLPHRTTCPVPSRFMPTLHAVQCFSIRAQLPGRWRSSCLYLVSGGTSEVPGPALEPAAPSGRGNGGAAG